jgi:hypothetical protein
MTDSAKKPAESLDYVRNLPGFQPNNPLYFDNEVVDHLISIVLELGAEIWVLRDRQVFLEELLAAQGVDLRARLETGRPAAATEAQLKSEREAMIKRIYGRLYSRYGGDKLEQATAPM